ncbi:thiamine-phosphate kinase [Tanticharoenia sakaeratensis]|uniref:Thiamine-monophosphate kinase n=1 Tax=Tanticharoenia sakaeratensis NBRC 103193 TaxID=1231623 RepID=A0A0D6MIW7_9PROT|nr:thiamine-phosphate kinase [Tanticharoenia sakaeratensis]GAN53426.1 thiamine-monophosphate kinase [Tanticharoenia sakaeratensis NBRC 103193]GBQ20689.1 thiamine monophosphate kinase [Tanticharoenia sakaeratensis NBRC 103193]
MTDDPQAPGEFGFIARHFAPLAGPEGLGLGDDAALFRPSAGMETVISADMMVEAVHFFPDDPPDLIARKLLRCNLSDLAAMGAVPRGYLLAIAKPDRLHDAWFSEFARGLATDQATFGLTLFGGDTTRSTGPLVLSLTILGDVPAGAALRRSGARPGDSVWASGTIGDAALGLLARQGKLPDPDGMLRDRYLLPHPRMGLGLAVRDIAHAAMDISDGLVQDAGHLARASNVRITIDADCVPSSAAARAAGGDWLETRLTGGDDYELLLTCPADRTDALLAAASASGTALTRIGAVEPGQGVVVLDQAGRGISFARPGWQHF